MICIDCRNDYHEGCRGGTWCPCQHRVPTIEVPLKSGGALVLRATTEDDLPVEVADAIDRIMAHPELLVRRERPQRKPEGQMTEYQKAEYEYSVQEEALRAAAATELTQLAQEMELDNDGFHDDYEASLKVATEGGIVEG